MERKYVPRDARRKLPFSQRDEPDYKMIEPESMLDIRMTTLQPQGEPPKASKKKAASRLEEAETTSDVKACVKTKKPAVEEKRALRQSLHKRIENIQATEIRDILDEDKELDICHLPEPSEDIDDATQHHLQNDDVMKELLLEASKISLPKDDKKDEGSSNAATYNSSKPNSFSSNLSSVSSTGFINSESSDGDRVDSITSVSARSGSSGFSRYSPSSGSCRSDTSSGSGLCVVGSSAPSPSTSAYSYHKAANMKLQTTLDSFGKPLLERPEFASVDPVDIAKQRERDIQAAAAEKIYGFTTESKEFIKNEPEFIIPGPNPQRIPHDELMNTFAGFTNMFLAHEISLNEEFRLERYTPPPESLESRVQVQLKRAFWDLFNEEIHKDPPQYVRALSVFKDLKTSLLDILLPYNTKIRDRINDVLDVEYISKLIEKDAFTTKDFDKYTGFIIETLGNLCSPSRDPDVEALRHLKGPDKIFEGVMDLLDKMKVDIANYYIHQFRPTIVQNCAQYERIKFGDFLQIERRLGEDGLRMTRNWLARHSISRRDIPTVLAKAYVELLAVNYDQEVPETLTLDIGRYRLVSQKILRLSVVGATVLTVGAAAQSLAPEIPHEFRDLLKKHMRIIISDADMLDTKKFNDCIESAAEEAVSIVDEFMRQVHKNLGDEEKDNIRRCVREIQNPDNKVRGLIFRRIIDYTEEILVSQYKFHVAIPVGLSAVRTEVMNLIGDFSQVVWHNRVVYGDLYEAMIENTVGRFTVFSETENDPELDKVMKILHQESIVERPSHTTETTSSGTGTANS